MLAGVVRQGNSPKRLGCAIVGIAPTHDACSSLMISLYSSFALFSLYRWLETRHLFLYLSEGAIALQFGYLTNSNNCNRGIGKEAQSLASSQ